MTILFENSLEEVLEIIHIELPFKDKTQNNDIVLYLDQREANSVVGEFAQVIRLDPLPDQNTLAVYLCILSLPLDFQCFILAKKCLNGGETFGVENRPRRLLPLKLNVLTEAFDDLTDRLTMTDSPLMGRILAGHEIPIPKPDLDRGPNDTPPRPKLKLIKLKK